MKDKYKKFYMMFDKRFKNLILYSNLNSDGGVISNSALKKRNYGNFCNFGFCFWTYRISSNKKTHKDVETKGYSLRGTQKRVMRFSGTLSDS